MQKKFNTVITKEAFFNKGTCWSYLVLECYCLFTFAKPYLNFVYCGTCRLWSFSCGVFSLFWGMKGKIWNMYRSTMKHPCRRMGFNNWGSIEWSFCLFLFSVTTVELGPYLFHQCLWFVFLSQKLENFS